ncbi:hypothetical protein ACWKSP_16590 [Micromonosporaceae bacterium Da 78-11]
MSIRSLNSLATTAFDSAKSSLKAMADAAAAARADATTVAPDANTALTSGSAGDAAATTKAVGVIEKAVAERTAAGWQEAAAKPATRRGTVLDSTA